jgi:SET domain-containing protein
MSKPYKERYSFEERLGKVRSFQESDPDKVMVIVERHPRSKLPDLQNSKYLPPYAGSSPSAASSTDR